MGMLFDDISRIVASPIQRRQAFKRIAGMLISSGLAIQWTRRACAGDGCTVDKPAVMPFVPPGGGVRGRRAVRPPACLANETPCGKGPVGEQFCCPPGQVCCDPTEHLCGIMCSLSQCCTPPQDCFSSSPL